MPLLHPEALALSDAVGDERGLWGEHPDHRVADWQAEVADDNTRLGYWEWVLARTEDDGADAPEDDPACCDECGAETPDGFGPGPEHEESCSLCEAAGRSGRPAVARDT